MSTSIKAIGGKFLVILAAVVTVVAIVVTVHLSWNTEPLQADGNPSAESDLGPGTEGGPRTGGIDGTVGAGASDTAANERANNRVYPTPAPPPAPTPNPRSSHDPNGRCVGELGPGRPCNN